MTPKKKWLLTGGIGASLFGFGLCGVLESGFLKHGDVAWWIWSSLGTVALSVTILGLVLLIKAGVMEKDYK